MVSPRFPAENVGGTGADQIDISVIVGVVGEREM
jgi:hypothetical protein